MGGKIGRLGSLLCKKKRKRKEEKAKNLNIGIDYS